MIAAVALVVVGYLVAMALYTSIAKR